MATTTKYKIKEKYKSLMAKYAWTKLDLDGIYSKEDWNKAGFKDSVLEIIKYKKKLIIKN
jgi:hypothetical protein